jgi:hypothetical protein
VSAERYWRQAAECMQLSFSAPNARSRSTFLQMAILWDALARHAERKQQGASVAQQQQQPQKDPAE